MHCLPTLLLLSAFAPPRASAPAPKSDGWLPTPIALDRAQVGFPNQAAVDVGDDVLFVDAIFFHNHAEIFGADLVDDENALPLALRIGLRGERQEKSSFKVSPESMQLRLFLPDGTALEAIAYSSLRAKGKDTQQAVLQEALKADTPLGAYREDGRVYFVYFRLPAGTEVDGTELVRARGRFKQKLSLLGSIVSLRVSDPKNGAHTQVRVGLREDLRVIPKS